MKFDTLFHHFLAKVKPKASEGLENRNLRPKIHGYCLFLGSNRENKKWPAAERQANKQTHIRYRIDKTTIYYQV